MKEQFFAAIKKGDMQAVQFLLSRDKSLVIATDENGRTGLHIAAFLGNEGLVNYLLDKSAAIEDKEAKANAAPLHMAVQAKHANVAILLLNRKAQVDATMQGNYTALHLAASVGDDKVLEVLLRARALIDARTDKQCTALHLAAQNGHENAVRQLVTANADIEARQKANWTPLHFAAQNGHDAVIGLLLRRNANVNAIADNQITPLHLAAQNGRVTSVEILVRSGATIEAIDKEGRWTPLFMAVKAGHLGTVNILLRLGASTFMLTKGGNTVLHIAALYNQPTIIGPLIAKNPALREKQNSEFKTALQLAREKNHQAVVQGLETNQVLQSTSVALSSYSALSPVLATPPASHYKSALPAVQNNTSVYANNLQWTSLEEMNREMEEALRQQPQQSQNNQLTQKAQYANAPTQQAKISDVYASTQWGSLDEANRDIGQAMQQQNQNGQSVARASGGVPAQPVISKNSQVIARAPYPQPQSPSALGVNQAAGGQKSQDNYDDVVAVQLMNATQLKR
jgi:ankyrin repeat protein